MNGSFILVMRACLSRVRCTCDSVHACDSVYVCDSVHVVTRCTCGCLRADRVVRACRSVVCVRAETVTVSPLPPRYGLMGVGGGGCGRGERPCASACECVCVCVCVCSARVHAYAHAHTHTHTHSPSLSNSLCLCVRETDRQTERTGKDVDGVPASEQQFCSFFHVALCTQMPPTTSWGGVGVWGVRGSDTYQ